jgi:hypothetical protein
MNHSRLAAALAVAAGLAAPAMADTISVTPTTNGRGWYYSVDGGATAYHDAATQRLFAGYNGEYRGFTIFNIPSSTSVITGAVLRINGFSQYGAGTLNLLAYQGNTTQLSASTLLSQNIVHFTAAGGTIWNALGAGPALASTTFGDSNLAPIDIAFNLDVAALNAHIGAVGNTFAFGYTATAANNSSIRRYAYFGSYPNSPGPGFGSISLELTYAPVQVVPLPPAVWGGAAGLAGVAFIARRRRMTAN